MRVFESYDWTPVTMGHSGVPTFRLTASGRSPLYAKRAPRRDSSDPAAPPADAGSGTRVDLLAEAERVAWLRKAGLPGPELVDVGISDEAQWLVMTEVPGRSGAEPWPGHCRNAVIDAIADMLHPLHATPASECPFRIDPLTAEDSPAAVGALASADSVVTHGDYCLPNMLLDPETLRPTGFVDVGDLGVADRYRDLAAAGMSIGSDELNPQYDDGHVARFFARYGADPADPRREAHLRAYELG